MAVPEPTPAGPTPTGKEVRSPFDRAATVLAATALLLFPTVGVLAKHGMSTIAIALAVLLILLLRRRGGYGPGQGLIAGAWRAVRVPMLTAGGLMVLSFIHLAVGPDSRGCDEALAEAAPAVVLLIALVGVSGVLAFDRPVLRRALFIGLAVGMIVAAVELLADAPIHRLLEGRSPDEPVGLSRYNRGVITLGFLGVAMIGALCLARRWPLAAGLAVAVLAVTLLSVTQAALLAVVVAALTAALALRWEQATRWGLVVAVSAGTLAAPWLAPVAYDLAEPRRADIGLANQHRFELWDHAAALARERPLTGWGIDGFNRRPIAPERLERAVKMTKPETHPHNASLQLWVEGGVLAVALGIGFLVSVALAIGRLAAEVRPWATALMAACMAPVLVSLGLWQVTYLAMVAMTVFAFQILRDPEPETAP